MNEYVYAPWTDEQVESLNGYQVAGVFHPFTCGHCRDTLGTRFVREDDGSLRPIPDEDEWAELFSRGWDAMHLVWDDHLLVATPQGWTCPTCDGQQDWAWEWMADGRWRTMTAWARVAGD